MSCQVFKHRYSSRQSVGLTENSTRFAALNVAVLTIRYLHLNDNTRMKKYFNYVVIGSGSAGCVIAGNTSAHTIMIAEKATDMVKAAYLTEELI